MFKVVENDSGSGIEKVSILDNIFILIGQVKPVLQDTSLSVFQSFCLC